MGNLSNSLDVEETSVMGVFEVSELFDEKLDRDVA